MTFQSSVSEISAVGGLPHGVVLIERAAAVLRGFLQARGLDDYVVFAAHHLDEDGLDAMLPRLDAEARWEPLALMEGPGEQPAALERDGDRARFEPAGVLHLPGHGVVLARWYVWNMRLNYRQKVMMGAAARAGDFERFAKRVTAMRREENRGAWTIFGDVCAIESKLRMPMDWSDLLLPDEILERLRAEVLNFFAPEVGELYRKLKVAYRRGMLLHGAPGNGKTSIIRAIGASLPDVPAIILRPAEGFDKGDLERVFARWVEHAPAMLIIEDLDHALKSMDLAQFLNLVDGIESSATGGLLLIATTNHPDELYPAINSRPGRFDVVMEVSPPDAVLRSRFFRVQLPEMDEQLLTELKRESAGLSFCHLHEVVRLSGLMSLNDGRGVRTAEQIREALELVKEAYGAARRGFPMASETPFGLAQFRRERE